MNGAAFANLPQLAKLDLSSNVCVNKLFTIESCSSTFRRKISKNCASDDATRKQLSCSASIACDEEVGGWQDKCCELELGTVIDSSDYTFVADTNFATVEILIIAHQRNVEFLPILDHERFPSVELYYVVNTPVKKISKKNFEKMFKLENLKLDRNQIEVISSDTFEDLVNLKLIQISTLWRG